MSRRSMLPRKLRVDDVAIVGGDMSGDGLGADGHLCLRSRTCRRLLKNPVPLGLGFAAYVEAGAVARPGGSPLGARCQR